MNKVIEILKNPQQNQELHQKIIYALCNLNDYQVYYQEKPMDYEEDKKERIKEHKKSIINNKYSTGLAIHSIENKHHYDGNLKSLHTFERSSILNLFEANEINKVINSG